MDQKGEGAEAFLRKPGIIAGGMPRTELFPKPDALTLAQVLCAHLFRLLGLALHFCFCARLLCAAAQAPSAQQCCLDSVFAWKALKALLQRALACVCCDFILGKACSAETLHRAVKCST